MLQDFVSKERLFTKKAKLAFAQSVSNEIFGEEAAKNSPAEWEELGGNKRFNLHPSSNNWWLHPPGVMSRKWRISARYASKEKVHQILTPFAKKIL